MAGEAVGVLGIAVALLSVVIPMLKPDVSRKVALVSFIIGLILIGVGGAMFFIPKSGEPSASAPSNSSGIQAPQNNGIITQGQTGGSNSVRNK